MKKWFLLGLFSVCSAHAAETQIGEAKNIHGMEVGAVYLQAVRMKHGDHESQDMKNMPEIHLEADIHALADNPHGFEEGAWVPYLSINYQLEKLGSDWTQKGTFIPMVANDGPHYGENIPMQGAGKYRVSYHIEPPSTNGLHHHYDKETGVADWWQPFNVSWEFVYLGAGKKGGY